MKIKDSFHLYAVTTIVFWALAFVFTRLALQYFSVYSLGFLRYAIASCTLAAVAVTIKMGLPAKEDIKWFAASGATGIFLYMIAFNNGSETLNASTSGIILAIAPVLTTLLAHFIYKERLKMFQWIAVAVAFSGVVVLTMANGTFVISVGLVWQLGAAVLFSIYNILQRKLTKKYSALQTSVFSIFAGTIMLAIFLPGSVQEAQNAPAVQLFYLVVLGIFSSALAYVSWSVAFAKAKYTSSVSNYLFLSPFLITLFGFLIAGETPDSSTIWGGLIILTGLFIFNFGGKLRLA